MTNKYSNLSFAPVVERSTIPTDQRPKARDTWLPYLPGLDGLRALAVIAVILYHAGVSWMPGGFLGVEVFFVISGYLITALLLAERRKYGRINLKAFWLRRARRLLPALFLLLLVTLTFSAIFLPHELAGLRADALAAFGYVTNWYLILAQKSYFETVGRPSLLQHLWSLAVEEQFYLLWPLLLSVALTFWRRQRVLAMVIGGALFSTVLMALLYSPDVDPSRVYYGTDTRAAGLLIGAALGFVWTPWRTSHKWQGEKRQAVATFLNIGGFGALGLLIWFLMVIDQFDPFLYQGGFALVALLTAVIIAVAVHPLAHLAPVLLVWWPLRWAGTRSYSIYLWHWPIFMLTRPYLDLTFDGLPLLVLRLAFTGLLAEISYRCIEIPLRTNALRRAWQKMQVAQGFQRQQLRLRWAGVATALLSVSIFLTVAVAGAQPASPPEYLAAAITTPTTDSIPHILKPEFVTARPVVSSTVAPTTTLTVVSATAPATTTASAPALITAPTATSQPPAKAAEPAPPKAPTQSPKFAPGQITAIGDSVMRSASQPLFNTIGGLSIDAEVGLQVAPAINILRARRDSGQLGKVVIIHLGNNGTFSPKHFDEIMEVLKSVPRVIFVNLKVPRVWEASNNRVISEGVKRYSNTVLVDWRGATIGHPELFWDDGIHPRPEGAQLYVRLISAQL